MAGVSRLQYTNEIRLIRVMCTGRVDLAHILRAFLKGQDGVLVGGCRLNECNYVTQGNYDALGNVYLAKKILERTGLNPERLRIAFMSSGDGILLAEVINEFTETVRQLGPAGRGEGVERQDLGQRLEAALRLVPYIKLVERERLRVPVKTEKGYHEFFTGEQFKGLFDELIGGKLTVSRILQLLGQKPRSAGEISQELGLDASEVSRHMNSSSRQGLVRYDMDSKCYLLA